MRSPKWIHFPYWSKAHTKLLTGKNLVCWKIFPSGTPSLKWQLGCPAACNLLLDTCSHPLSKESSQQQQQMCFWWHVYGVPVLLHELSRLSLLLSLSYSFLSINYTKVEVDETDIQIAVTPFLSPPRSLYPQSLTQQLHISLSLLLL